MHENYFIFLYFAADLIAFVASVAFAAFEAIGSLAFLALQLDL
jgi:hypothetical protein